MQRRRQVDLLKNPKIIEPTPKIKPALVKKATVWAIIAALLAVLAGWLLFFSPYFRVKDILIEGEVSTDTKQAIENFRGRNIFAIGGRRAERDLQTKQPWIKSIKIIRGIPDTVRVRVIERDAVIAWLSQDKLYHIDKEGVVSKQVGETKLMVVSDSRNLPAALGQKVASADFIVFVEDLRKIMAPTIGIKPTGVEISDTTFSLTVATDRDFKIKLTTMRPLQRQLDDFAAFYKDKSSDITEYADMRVEGAVYYK